MLPLAWVFPIFFMEVDSFFVVVVKISLFIWLRERQHKQVEQQTKGEEEADTLPE